MDVREGKRSHKRLEETRDDRQAEVPRPHTHIQPPLSCTSTVYDESFVALLVGTTSSFFALLHSALISVRKAVVQYSHRNFNTV